MMGRIATIFALSVALLGATTGARAQFPEDDIEVIIPYAAGGGFDSYVRGVLPYLQKYLPNDVNLIPRNMPGAGGRKGATAIFRARPDGYTIGAFNLPGLMLPEILGERIAYDLSEVTWLGRLSEDQYLLVAAGSSGVTSVADLRALGRPIKFTATGAGSSAHAASVIAARMLGLDASVITGYEGSQAYILAVVRGDGDVALGASNSIGSYTATGDLRVIASLERSSSYPDAQTPAELGIPDLSQLALQRMLGAPPNLDPEARSILAEALQNALADEELISWSESIGLPFAPLSAEEAAANVTNQRALYEQFKDFL
ncbi:MAG: tripartite tricarboxylate transporter substrate binding protein [Gammaproteobacteria bacterium]|nr:tripartite tricarboxylate transporter substrate binding protein [Gammaproteobacteria bacterium]